VQWSVAVVVPGDDHPLGGGYGRFGRASVGPPDGTGLRRLTVLT
jgi:hypothetical protein